MKGLIAIALAWLPPWAATALPAPLSIDELRATEFSTGLQFERELEAGPGFTAYLVSYQSAGLTVYAMVAVPVGERPEFGFPVVVANHGFHPDPPRYGVTTDGVDARPGDYYRPIPELYARHGFLVIMPDYRGHNASEGLQFTDGFLAAGYYTEDVLALLSGLEDIEEADTRNVFMWGHSLGAEVSLRALLATERIRGATLWSGVGGEIWDQAYYYQRYEDRLAYDGSDMDNPRIDELRQDIAALDEPYDWTTREPLRYLDYLQAPIVIQHAVGDTGAPYHWSERLAKELYLLGRTYRFYSYPGTDHFFQGETLGEAVDRDVAYFRSLIRPADPDALPGLNSQSDR
ncbi:MAG: alpha/beta fold hydrolase [Proteobacteria bacterium]|nr:alpha/beta fold hydrolase [Pseudomonadota bacterium]MYJ94661.1 alpha/beta fold hydrolase [Pseudomonadota bacterium]